MLLLVVTTMFQAVTEKPYEPHGGLGTEDPGDPPSELMMNIVWIEIRRHVIVHPPRKETERIRDGEGPVRRKDQRGSCDAERKT